ncbi:hypothetical protein [Sphingomonas baiyangensis]|uniref:Uncharacterized protein n=1 Tax=Sphingomonas baiyangensis TaxID=2572576 RepID=A0A4U1L1V9_9SPHN|nr:hypothetical protein [Sphingomonas baiyangensis]TKD50190.1 hypothetical protein FBR43_05050 [Sphingomonas baiyangensis]
MTVGSNTRAAAYFAGEAPITTIAVRLVRYWSEPDFASALDAETEAQRAAGLAAENERNRRLWEQVWAKYPELNQ